MRTIALVLALHALGTVPAASQNSASAAARSKAVDGDARKAVVGKLAQLLRDLYVFPDVGEQAAAAVTAASERGDYDTLSDPAVLAARLTTELAVVTHDKHLRVVSQAAAPPPPAPSATAALREEAGIVRADKLASKIGYIEISLFPPLQLFKPVLDRALAKLNGSRALIIDDRRNGGGSPESVAYLVSYLLPPGRPITIMEYIGRTPGTRNLEHYSTMSSSTPFRFGDVPVYVLTSRATFSSGEELAYDLKAMNCATLVGEMTGGGANLVGSFKLGHDLLVAMPGRRSESPITKTNWEGVGVEPDVKVPATEALGAALKALGQKSVANIAAASRQQVFAPRTKPMPGSDTALARLIAMYATGKIDDSVFAPDAIERARENMPTMLEQRKHYGVLKSLTFREVLMGADTYIATFNNGAAVIGIAVNPQGRALGTTGFMPAPPSK